MKIRSGSSGWKRETNKIKFGSTGWKSKRPIRLLERIKTKQTTNQIARTMRREFRAVNQSKRPIRFENFGQSDWSVELVPRRAVNEGTRTSCQSSAFLDSDWTFAFFLESDWSFAFSASWAEFLSSLFLHFSHLSRILFIFLSQIHYDFRSKCVEFWDPRDWFGLSNRHIQGHGINHNFIFFSSVWLWK